MIEITVRENKEDIYHNDLIVEFCDLPNKLIGDTYWFLNFDGHDSYQSVYKNLVIHFQKWDLAIQNLLPNYSVFLYFLIFDEAQVGLEVKNISKTEFQVRLIDKYCSSVGDQVKFSEEVFSVSKALFIESLRSQIEKFKRKAS